MSLEWVNVLIAIVGVIVGGLSGLIAGVWRVARIDQGVRNDVNQQVSELRREMTEKVALVADQFAETLRGLRQKINDVELQTHKNFVSKSDFSEFREEYRDDMRDLKNSIAELRNLPKSAA